MIASQRFDHRAALAAAIELRHALRRHRRRLMVTSVLAPADERADIACAVGDLRTRERALQVFLENPYANDCLFDMRAEDRGVLIEAGGGLSGEKDSMDAADFEES